jgi:penicillin-binding protein 2
MKSRAAIKDQRTEAARFAVRALFSLLIVAAALIALLVRFGSLQIAQHEQFQVRSEANRIRLRPIAPARGFIFDRNGKLLADNRLAYRLEVIPEQVKDLPASLKRLAQIVPLGPEELERFAAERKSHRSFDSVPLKMRLSDQDLARFAVDRFSFPGIDVVPYLTRYYPMGAVLTHVLGYVGRIDADDLNHLDAENYDGTTHIGKSGVEAFYEAELHGRSGAERVETNVNGRAVTPPERIPPQAGKNLFLSIDLELQIAATAAFEGKSGAAVAIEPATGEVLAMVSVPTFDGNLFVNGISKADFQALLTSPDRPLYNRALQGTYAPGSTYKPFMGLAGLELGVRDAGYTIVSTGTYRLPTGGAQIYHDWKHSGHGRVDLTEALAQSVNTYFYQLAFDLNIDRMHDYMTQFGFGRSTGIDLQNENLGVLPNKAWKQNKYKQNWYPGETVVCGIGQGYNVVTPLQLAHATAIMANKTADARPHVLRAIASGDSGSTPTIIAPVIVPPFLKDANNWELVRTGMIKVLHGPTGTARAVAVGSTYLIAGKSGTAQQFGLARGQVYNEKNVSERLRNQALFIAYAPADNPRIAVAVIVEHGGGGSKAAGPIARKILDAYLLPHPPTPSPMP